MAPKRTKWPKLTKKQKTVIVFIIGAVGFFCGVTGINALSIWQLIHPNVIIVTNNILPPLTYNFKITASFYAVVTHGNQTIYLPETSH